jgi:SAM-dependent methyltransferase
MAINVEEEARRQSAHPPHILPLSSHPVGSAHPDIATQIAPAIQPDTDSSDEAYAESTTTSYVTSIASDISKGVLENDRIYPNYGQHSYGMPIDEDEMDRMDLQHRKYELVIGDKHFLAPIGPTPQRILDLGTGTGIWALDVADMFPSAEVIGVDIAPIQPKWVASNCQFEIDDVEADWMYKKDSFDFIHFRDPLYCIRDWPKLMGQCISHLRPGGWCEFACIYPVPMCDDGSMPENSGFKTVCRKFREAGKIFGTPLDAPIHFATYMREAGFVDISENIFKVPASPWPKDRRLKQIGALEMTNVMEGAEAFGFRVFHQVFGWSKEQIELVLIDMKRDVRNRAFHQYCQ